MKNKILNRINVGCGMTPTKNWYNIDNSFSLKLSKFIFISKILNKFGIIKDSQYNFILFCSKNNISWANVTKRIPFENNFFDVLYSSHMVEHLDRIEIKKFLKESLRVLDKNGIIRLAVPDLRRRIEYYNQTKDADGFMHSLHMCFPKPKKISDRISLAIYGSRNHQWMYDSQSLIKLLEENGFSNAKCYKAGESMIKDDKLNLSERINESIYIEAIKK
jgi:predicted SAM-dependent methyltransferase